MDWGCLGQPGRSDRQHSERPERARLDLPDAFASQTDLAAKVGERALPEAETAAIQLPKRWSARRSRPKR